ncbi:MAG: Hsp20/alpha crystallin family protein [Myxococcales bacterium]|nr:Hsp20/alpha crystallin family protein [Myxococcales bacterium]
MPSHQVHRPSVRSPLSGLLDELRRELHTPFFGPLLSREAAYQGTRGVFPPVNLYEEGDAYVLTAELPGVAPDAIDVSIEGSTITLSGERKIEYAAGEATAVHRRERQSGTFRRAFELPREIDLDGAKASHKNGVLTLRLPKAAKARPRQVTIETA